MKKHLKIEIVSDVSCPWCVVGYKSLSKALEKLAPEITADITWKPFELNPAMPAEGQNLEEHLFEKYGSSKTDIAEFREMITERGRLLDFVFDIKEDARIYNTFNAHRLLFWAKKYARQTELKLALFELYFTRNGNPGSIENLILTVEKAGLPTDEAKRLLDSDQYSKEVHEEEAKYKNMGIEMVPTFIINENHKLTGGQPVDEFISTLLKIVAEEPI